MKFLKKISMEKYNNIIKTVEDSKISNIRKNIKVLIVDDEDDEIYKVLKERQYEIYYKNDITYAIEAEPFDIILLDIKGVAKRLRSSMEGFAIACEIKQRYPYKKVCCYSGSVYKEISEEISRIDAFIVKDMDIDKIANKIDTLMLEYINLDSKWEIFRKELKNNNIPEKDIQQIKKVYYDGFKKNDFSNLQEIIGKTIKNGSLMIDLMSEIVKLIGVLSTN